MHTVAFVPCKGASRRVERKNVQFVGGLPLWLRKAQQLLRLDCVDEVWVDTDSDEIALDAQLRGFRVMRRPAAVNEYDGHQLFAWEVQEVERIRGLCSQVKADVYVQALCTAPFLSDASIVDCIDAVENECAYAACFTNHSGYEWIDGVPAHGNHIPPSDALVPRQEECMSLYAVDGAVARSEGLRTHGGAFERYVEGVEALDIDYPADLEHARAYAYGMNELEQSRLRALKPVLSSALLSDTMRELGLDGEFSLCLQGKCGQKLFGRACTLNLLDDYGLGREPQGTSIYDALQHYEWCMPGNILCVKGSCWYAYFGELNASLALRAGAQGAIIDGMTRDAAAVGALGFQVLSRGYTPKDCRDALTVGSIATTIDMFGIEVHHGDLIYADADGAVRIPREHEDVVLRDALDRVQNEGAIKLAVAQGMSVESILSSNGNF